MSFAIRRLLSLPIVLFGIAFVVFVAIRLIPGDPSAYLSGLTATAEQREQVRIELGLDKPIPVQFGIWLAHLAKGDLGKSLISSAPVAPLVIEYFWRTLSLAVSATLIATVGGVLLGVVAAAKRYSWIDNTVTIFALAWVSIPSFWLGVVLVLVFAVELHWLPSGGTGGWQHLVLPTIALSAFSLGFIARMTRASMLEALSQDYIRTARAKGATERRVLFAHALRNALLETLTLVGLQFGYLLAGAVVIESVFYWNGLGLLLINAIGSRDYPVVQGSVLLIAICVVVVNVVTDLLYTAVDPRIRL